MGANRLIDREEVLRAYSLLVGPDQVVELRALEASSNGQYPATYGGYFNNVDALLSALSQVRKAKGVYVTLQTCKPNLIHRTYNKLTRQQTNNSTSDKDITRYRWLLIDSDPDRDVANISASDEEHTNALAHSRMIAEKLSERGWPAPVIADSGNGGHLLYRIDLAVEEKDLVKRVLEGLAHLYDTSGVHVDQTVYNPGRICKLYGTLVCKGDSTTERPHRMSRLLEVPDSIEIVGRELLEEIAIPDQSIPLVLPNGIKEGFSAQDFIDKHHIDTYPSQDYAGGTRWQLKQCAWDSSHTDRSACIYQFPDGRLGASCSHNSCKGLGWKDFRQVFEPDAYTSKKPTRRKTRARNEPAPTQGNLPDTGKDLCQYSADDAGNGDAFYHLYGDTFLYCPSIGWLIYNGKFWELDENASKVRKSAVMVLRKRAHQAIDFEKKDILRCAVGDEKRVNGCMNRFKDLVTVSIDVFDKNPDVLNCQNGAVNLQTGELTPHVSSQRFTYCVPVDYEEADSTEWNNFLLADIGGSDKQQEVLDYFQKAVGYSLTGHTREEILFYLFGPPRSGKGTTSEILMKLLPRPLSIEIDFNSLTAKRNGDVSNFDLAGLKPARLIFASESERHQALNPAKIKQLTGGDEIRCCFKHRDHFSYRPQFNVWMLSNWPCNGDPDDDALWGRVRVIEFPNSFLGKEDKKLKARLKEVENLKGVLYWAVQGAIKWYAEGLITPAYVTLTTKAQRDEIDYIQQFVDECVPFIMTYVKRADGTKWIPNPVIYTQYTEWCKNNGVPAKSQRGFSQSLAVKKFQISEKQDYEGKRNVRGVVCPVDSTSLDVARSTCSTSFQENFSRETFPESSATSATCYKLDTNNEGDVSSPLMEEFTALRRRIETQIDYHKRYERRGIPQTFLWNASGYSKELLPFSDYLARVDELKNSDQIQAAIDAMKRTLEIRE